MSNNSQYRPGKYRHVFAKKKFTQVYDDLQVGVAFQDAQLLEVNKTFFASKFSL